MPSAVKSLDQNLRQQLAAMLSGDAKAGSVRADLVKGLLGSQTGDDAGLVGMTPLGAAFDVDAANRDMRQGGSGLGHTMSAAAGMIPGAGGLEAKAEELLGEQGFKKLTDDAGEAFFHHPDTDEVVRVQPNAWQHYGPVENNERQTHGGTTLQQLHNYMSGPGVSEEESRLASPGIRAQLEAAQNGTNPNDASKIITAKAAPSVAGMKVSTSDATHPQPVTVSRDPNNLGRQGALASHITDIQGEAKQNWKDLNNEAGLDKIAGGDPKKLNFIRNAMQDEGGNSPEDVAGTLMDHANQHDGALENLAVAHRLIEPGEKLPTNSPHMDSIMQELQSRLSDEHSIPEMLAMHYDLDPQTMGKAYDMPATASKSRPTQ